MPIYTITGDTSDGYFTTVKTSWASARSASSADSVKTNTTTMPSNATFSTPNYSINRIGYVFDTSSIGDSEIVTSAVLKTGFTVQTPSIDGATYCIVNWTAVTPNSFVVSDYSRFLTTVEIAARQSISSGQKQIPLYAAYLNSVINKTGYTNIGGMISLDFDNTTPTGTNTMTVYSASGTTPPTLNIVTSDSGAIFIKGAKIKGAKIL